MVSEVLMAEVEIYGRTVVGQVNFNHLAAPPVVLIQCDVAARFETGAHNTRFEDKQLVDTASMDEDTKI